MDSTNVKLGVCEVFADGVSLGHTIGGVEVTYSPEYHESMVDQYGSSLIEKYLIGERFTAKVPMAEFTLTKLNTAIPHGTVDGQKIEIGKSAGQKSSTHAVQLVLHPIANAAGNRTEDVVFWKAVCTSEIVIGHKNDGEKILEAVFDALIDETRTDGNLLGLIGDSAS